MPVHRAVGGWQWGNHGHVYAKKSDAEKQGRAAYAHGYRGADVSRRRRRARKNPLLSPTEERVVVVLGLASLIGIAYYIKNANPPSGNSAAVLNQGITDPNPSPAPQS